MCHLFLPLLSIFGLFPVLVSCRYELICVQLCVCDYVLITLCILVLSFEFDFVWSTRYFPGVSCPCQCCLDVYIKDYYLSLRPRLRVLVPPSCVHRDRRPDQNRKRRPFTPICFPFLKVFLFCFCLSVPRQGSRRSSSRLSLLQVGLGVWRDCRESAGREPSCPPIAGDIRRRLWLVPGFQGSRRLLLLWQWRPF